MRCRIFTRAAACQSALLLEVPDKTGGTGLQRLPVGLPRELLQRHLAGSDHGVDLVDTALGDAGPIVRLGREGLLQLRLLRGEDFLDLGGGETNGIVNLRHDEARLSTRALVGFTA